jgi:hypothetical protein
MAYTPPKVWYSATINGTYVELTGIQSINISRGRQRYTDPFAGSQCTIELIPANSYSPALAIGQFLDIRATNSASSPAFFAGRITDVERSYGIPYNASATIAAPADRIILTCTGGTGVAASQGITSDFSIDDRYSAITNLFTLLQSYAKVVTNVYGDQYGAAAVSNQTITAGGQVWDVTNQLLRTAQWFIDDDDIGRQSLSAKDYSVAVLAPGTSTAVTFQDNGTTGYKYSGLDYLSTVQQTFSTVIVEPVGLTPQYAESGSLLNSFSFTTYNKTTAEALSLASYVQTLSLETLPTPFVIRTSTVVADTVDVLARFVTYPVGITATVKFRGTTVNGTVQGWQFGFYPDMATVSCYLSPSLGTPFTLDSTAFGVLDTDRLGYP